MQTTAWLSEAVSPAFLIENYDFSSPKYSAWTESVWKTISGKFTLLLMDAGRLGLTLYLPKVSNLTKFDLISLSLTS